MNPQSQINLINNSNQSVRSLMNKILFIMTGIPSMNVQTCTIISIK